MSFHISSWSIKNPIPTIVTFATLGIIGYFAFLGLGINDSPNIDVPAVSVTVTQRGAGPAELESQVTEKIEDAVAGLGNIDKLTSSVTDGRSTTTVEFVLGTDSDRATNDVRNAVAQIRQDLPQGVEEPIVRRLQFSGSSIMTYAVFSKQRSVEDLSNLVDRTIITKLQSVQGVAQIDRAGGVDREIRVDLDPDRLQAYNITATEVNEQIRQFNINLPGGRSEVGGSEQNVRTLGSAKTVKELANYSISLPQGDAVTLETLGKVTDSYADLRQSAYLNGKPVVAFSVLRSSGTNLVTVEGGVKEEVAKLIKTLPKDITLKLVFTRGDAIRDSYHGIINDLTLGSVMTVITVGLFLWNWRMTLIAAIALPASILPTFWVMKAFGYTLNSMTLLALTLALGNLIDDAVCMIEDIARHIEMGKKPIQAAFDGSRELGLAVLASAATIIAVFLPVAFMGGVPGQFFQPFGVTVAVSTFFSSLVAATVTPMLCAYLLKSHQPENNAGFSLFKNKHFYRRLINWTLQHRIITIIIAIAFFIFSLQLIPLIPKGLFSGGDTGLSTISVELPPGSQLQETEEVVQQINNLLQKNEVVTSVLGTVGVSAGRGNASSGGVDSASVYVNLLPREKRKISQKEFQQQMREQFRQIPGAKISFRAQGGAGSSKDLSLILRSDNPESLDRAADGILGQMRSIPGLVEINSSASLVKPEITIKPNPDRAGDLGVSVNSIARTASLALIGDNDSNLPKFNLPDRQIPIRVQLNPQYRQDLETIKNLKIPAANGNLVPLMSVADLSLSNGAAEIKRFNRNRQVALEANLQNISLGDALAKVRALPALKSLPSDVTEEPSGDAKIMRDIFSRFLGALGLAVLAIYVILVLLYNNFLYPLAILVSLPFSIGGTLLGLLVMQKELGLFALIGIVLLMGLVTKNAILLVDFSLAALKEGKPLFKAVVEAGVSRLRPILMTSVSTIAGMLPIALELGADGQTRSPMAIAIIGGFTTSTLLTLLVVPVLFTYVDTFLHRLGKVFKSQKSALRQAQ
jgi:hydrophobe/amphiphile efflux-1 (HAE1) family protein